MNIGRDWVFINVLVMASLTKYPFYWLFETTGIKLLSVLIVYVPKNICTITC